MRWLLLLVLACGVDDPPGESAACLASEDGECDDACEGASVCSFDGSEGFSDCSACAAENQLLSVLCDEGSDASEEELEGIECGPSAACQAREDSDCGDICKAPVVCSFDGREGFSECSSCAAQRELLSVLCDEGSDASEEELEEIQCNAVP